MAQRHQAGIVFANALHGPRAEASHQAHEAFFAAQARVPDDRGKAKGDAGDRGEEITVVSLALDLLQQDRHALIVVQQPHAATIKQRVWIV